MFGLIPLILASTALAQDPSYDKTVAAPIAHEKPENDLTAELGFVFTAGNAFNITLNAGAAYSHKWQQNQIRFFGGAVLNLAAPDTDGDGTVADLQVDTDGDGDPDETSPPDFTSQRGFGGARYDRFIGEKNALYLSAMGEHDRYAGVYFRFNQQFGYRRVLVKNDTTSADLEFGLAYNEENLVEGVDAAGNGTNTATLDAHYLAFRAFFGISHSFNKVASISEGIEVFEPLLAFRDPSAGGSPGDITNFEDFRFVNVFALTLTVSDKFSVKISDRLAFDNQPTGEEFSKVDNTVGITLVATIL